MEEIKIDVAHKQITWPGEAPAITSRPVAGPRGQTELIDTSGWGAGDYT